MITDVSEINVYFGDSNAPGFLTTDSCDAGGDPFVRSLNWDFVTAHRKTPLSTIVERIASHIVKKYDSRIVKVASDLVSYILLIALDPSFIVSSKRALLMEKNLFREVEPCFFYDAYGKKCITDEDLSRLSQRINREDLDELLATLEAEKLLTRMPGKYCIDGFVIKNLKIG